MAKNIKNKSVSQPIFFSPRIAIFPFENHDQKFNMSKKTGDNPVKWLNLNNLPRKASEHKIIRSPKFSINVQKLNTPLSPQPNPLQLLQNDSFFDSRTFINIQTLKPQTFTKKFARTEFFRPQTSGKTIFHRGNPASLKNTVTSPRINQFDFSCLNKNCKNFSSHVNNNVFPKGTTVKSKEFEEEVPFRPFSAKISTEKPILNPNQQSFHKKIENWVILQEMRKIREFKSLNLRVIKNKKSNSVGLITPNCETKEKPIKMQKNSENTQRNEVLRENARKNDEKYRTFHFNGSGINRENDAIFGKGEGINPWLISSDSFNDSALPKT